MNNDQQEMKRAKDHLRAIQASTPLPASPEAQTREIGRDLFNLCRDILRKRPEALREAGRDTDEDVALIRNAHRILFGPN